LVNRENVRLSLGFRDLKPVAGLAESNSCI